MLIFVGILLAGNPYDSNGLSAGAFSQKKIDKNGKPLSEINS